MPLEPSCRQLVGGRTGARQPVQPAACEPAVARHITTHGLSTYQSMDDGERELSDHVTGNSSNTFCAPLKLEDSLVDDSLKSKRTCTHNHVDRDDLMESGRQSGNRVAVRKYREKKKAQNAYLEEEVKKLRVVNRGLIRRLQFQAGLESEALRLRSLLLDLKARIDKELGVCSFYKENCNGSSGGD